MYYPFGNNQSNFNMMQQCPGEPVWVQGKAGAQSAYVQPGKTAFLFDSEKPVFYIKTVNQNGMPQPLQEFEYKELSPQQVPQTQSDMSQYVTKEELKEILAEYGGKQHEQPVQEVRKNGATKSNA